MQVRLTYRDPLGAAHAAGRDTDADAVGVGVSVPEVCPRAGCGGRRLRLRQTVVKRVRGEHPSSTVAHRYTCFDCRRTFRAYPAGIDRGQVPQGVKALAAGLHLLGLGFRDASRALTVLGVPLGKSQIQVATAAIVGETRAGDARAGDACAGDARFPDDTRVDKARAADVARARDTHAAVAARAGNARAGCCAPLFTAVGFHAEDHSLPAGVNPRAWIEVDGTRRSLRRVVDARGRPVLVIDDVDVYTRRQIERWGRDLLAEIGVEVEIVADAITGSWGAERSRRDRGEPWEAAGESNDGEYQGDEAGADGADGDGGAPGDGGPCRDEDALGDGGMPDDEGPPGNAGASADEVGQGADALHMADHRDRVAASTSVRFSAGMAAAIAGSRTLAPAHHRGRPNRCFAVMAPPPVPATLPRSRPFWGRGMGVGGRLGLQTPTPRPRAA